MLPNRFASLARWPTRLRCLAALGLVLASLQASATEEAADLPTDCALLWRVTVGLDSEPRQLRLEMIFDAGARQRSTLRLPGGWAGITELADDGTAAPSPRLQAVPGAPLLRSLAHAAGERVRLQWRLQPAAAGAPGSGMRLAARWFAFSGQGVLPVPDEIDERAPPTACIALAGLPADSRWLGSHGAAEGSTALFRVADGAAPLATRVQQALYAGGALQVLSQSSPPLTVAMPPDAPWRFGIAALAQASAKAVAAQRRYWGDEAPGLPWLVLLMPDPSASAGGAGGTAWHQGLALQAPTDLAVPSAGFDSLITQALARAWVAERFGPLAHAGRGDEGLRTWFSEGWADFLAHRSLLREGQWTAEDYAMALNRKIERYVDASAPGSAAATDAGALPAARGEWLALRWHAALRAAGRPGLEAQLQRLLVPAAQARREGPISAPLATHRLLAAVRPVLGDAALGDIKRYVDQGEAFAFGPATLGPCFIGQRQRLGHWQLGFDAASLARGVVSGVVSGGPAEAAGLRDGMVLRGHALSPGDASQPVRLQVLGEAGQITELRYLPADAQQRELTRYQPVPQALQQNACLGWLGLGPESAVASGSSAGRSSAVAKTKAKSKAGAASGSKGSKKTAPKRGNKGTPKAATKSSGTGAR
jgi:hypothetical protein